LCSPADNKIIESITTGGHEVRPYAPNINIWPWTWISVCRGEPCVLPQIIK